MKTSKKSLDEQQGQFDEPIQLVLYIAGLTTRSIAAIESVRRICKRAKQGRVNFEVVNILESPQRAKSDQIFAVPTLLKKNPLPVRRVIGEISDTENIISHLELNAIFERQEETA